LVLVSHFIEDPSPDAEERQTDIVGPIKKATSEPGRHGRGAGGGEGGSVATPLPLKAVKGGERGVKRRSFICDKRHEMVLTFGRLFIGTLTFCIYSKRRAFIQA
jgi:hypothetical protein